LNSSRLHPIALLQRLDHLEVRLAIIEARGELVGAGAFGVALARLGAPAGRGSVKP